MIFIQKTLKSIQFILLLCIVLFVVSCTDHGNTNTTGQAGEYKGAKAKYVFLFIGDGMGISQTYAAEAYQSALKGKRVEMIYSKFPAQGITTTYCQNRFITGSAAAATAIACGKKTTVDTISMNGSRTEKLKTMAELAKEKNMKVGIVTSVSIDHATPAAFYAHVPVRHMVYEIAQQLTASNFDYFGGGGAAGNKYYKRKGRPDIVKMAKQNGYKIIRRREEFKTIQKEDKVWAFNHTLNSSCALYYDIDRPSSHITLKEFTKFGIEHLYNPNGFFLMVEGGKIDWACHANDARTAIGETIAFNDAVKEAYEFYKKHPKETLIVVTGDHECGGLTIGFAATKYKTAFQKLKHQKYSNEVFTGKLKEFKETHDLNKISLKDVMPLIIKYFGFGKGELALKKFEIEKLEKAFKESVAMTKKGYKRNPILYSYYDPLTVTLTHIINNKAGLGWTSYAHTGTPVATSAVGVGSYLFNGRYDNTDIFHKISTIADFSKQENDKQNKPAKKSA